MPQYVAVEEIIHAKYEFTKQNIFRLSLAYKPRCFGLSSVGNYWWFELLPFSSRVED